MLTLYHAPNSRSGTITDLIERMGVTDQVKIVEVTIPRQDGSGGRDPANPHPEGKVPYLTDGEDWVRERGAIILYLTDRFDSPLGRPVGHPQRGRYVSWLVWYQGVCEPVGVFAAAGLSHPFLDATFRDLPTALAQIAAALEGQDYLLGDQMSAADLLIAGMLGFFPQIIPEEGPIKAWVARCHGQG